MAKNLRLFETTNDYTTAQSEFEFPTVSYVEETSELHYMVDPSKAANGHEYVDLGLPSGLKWATSNVGASSPEEYGMFFAWGETTGYYASQVGFDKGFTWDDYNYAENPDKLSPSNDAASVNMGGAWRMPTSGECQELISHTTTAWTTVNGVQGVKFTSKQAGYTDKYIFIPAAGYCQNNGYYDEGVIGNVWSSSINSVNTSGARYLNLKNTTVGLAGYDSRRSGRSVRGVIG